MQTITKITFPKFAIVLVLVILFALVYFSGLLSFSKALPFQQCGGSTLKAKECISGFTCKYSSNPCDGCGGVCVFDLK
jgi:hypothetical protein